MQYLYILINCFIILFSIFCFFLHYMLTLVAYTHISNVTLTQCLHTCTGARVSADIHTGSVNFPAQWLYILYLNGYREVNKVIVTSVSIQLRTYTPSPPHTRRGKENNALSVWYLQIHFNFSYTKAFDGSVFIRKHLLERQLWFW